MKAALAVAVALVVSACNYSHSKSRPANVGLKPEQLSNPDFATVMNAVLGPKCVGCHVTGGSAGSTPLTDYPSVKKVSGSVLLFRTLEKRDMPPGQPLSEAEGILLKRWIDNGSPEKVVGIGEKPAEDLNQGPTNWAKIKSRIFNTKCVDCHQPPSPEAGIDLTDLKLVKPLILEILGSIFGDGKGAGANMPPAPYPAVTPGEREIILKWFNLGMPE